MAVRPVVRLFVACWNGVPGTPVERHHLGDTTNIVRPAAGHRYPLLQPELNFYAQLTGGRGRHAFSVEQRFGVGPDELVIWESRPVIVEMGGDPIAIRGLSLRIRDIRFVLPGQYEFALMCDGVELHSVYVEARE